MNEESNFAHSWRVLVSGEEGVVQEREVVLSLPHLQFGSIGEMAPICETSGLTLVTHFLQPGSGPESSTAFQTSSNSWGPNVQT